MDISEEEKRRKKYTNALKKFVADALQGDDKEAVNKKVKHGPENIWTPLMVACQFASLNRQLQTEFSSDTVRRLIAAGADVNAINPVNKITALFFAVKYSDIDTVEALLEAGALPNHKDFLGRTALYNAVEACNPSIVERLLQSGCSSADRVVDLMFMEDDGSMTCLNSGEKLNYAEHMLFVDGDDKMSWKILTPPSLTDYVSCFQKLLLSGAEIGRYSMLKIGRYAAGNTDGLWNKYDTACIKAFLGTEFPEPRERVPIESIPAPSQRNECLPRHAKVFDRLLYGSGIRLDKLLKYIDEHPTFGDRSLILGFLPPKGAASMSMKQLRIECVALGLFTAAECEVVSREVLEMKLLTHADSPMGSTTFTPSDSNHGAFEAKIVFDTSSTRDIAGGNRLICTPTLGPACIKVDINGIPVCAFISSHSPITCMPSALANQAGIGYSESNLKKLYTVEGDDVNDCKLIHSMKVRLDEKVTVELRNVLCSEHFQRLQLGEDFLSEAVWSTIEVFAFGDESKLTSWNDYCGNVLETTQSRLVSLHCGYSSNVSTINSPRENARENMRFHAKNGETCTLPIFHVQDGVYGMVSTKDNCKIKMCDWCGRMFPGLKRCVTCPTHYCSEICQAKAWPSHRHSALHKSSTGSST